MVVAPAVLLRLHLDIHLLDERLEVLQRRRRRGGCGHRGGGGGGGQQHPRRRGTVSPNWIRCPAQLSQCISGRGQGGGGCTPRQSVSMPSASFVLCSSCRQRVSEQRHHHTAAAAATTRPYAARGPTVRKWREARGQQDGDEQQETARQARGRTRNGQQQQQPRRTEQTGQGAAEDGSATSSAALVAAAAAASPSAWAASCCRAAPSAAPNSPTISSPSTPANTSCGVGRSAGGTITAVPWRGKQAAEHKGQMARALARKGSGGTKGQRRCRHSPLWPGRLPRPPLRAQTRSASSANEAGRREDRATSTVET